MEARLDLVVRYPGAAFAERVDVSVHSPYAACFVRARAQRATTHQVGVASREGEADKHRRYGPDVAPLVFETLGRLGRE